MHTTITKSNRDAKKRSAIYLSLTVGFCLLVGVISILAPAETGQLSIGFYPLLTSNIHSHYSTLASQI
ncbi:hypothetical protein FACS1894191_4610 [Clostridia bacterium]|nr:hypothetical protein FACS1894191_4610 [Clostridia bacterium]